MDFCLDCNGSGNGPEGTPCESCDGTGYDVEESWETYPEADDVPAHTTDVYHYQESKQNDQ